MDKLFIIYIDSELLNAHRAHRDRERGGELNEPADDLIIRQ